MALDQALADKTIFLIENGWINSDVRNLTFRQLDLFVVRTLARIERIKDQMKKR
jgi:hypothetical protein